MERYTSARKRAVKAALSVLGGAGILTGTLTGFGLTLQRDANGQVVPVVIQAPRSASADCQGPPPRPDLDNCGNPLPTPTPSPTPTSD